MRRICQTPNSERLLPSELEVGFQPTLFDYFRVQEAFRPLAGRDHPRIALFVDNRYYGLQLRSRGTVPDGWQNGGTQAGLVTYQLPDLAAFL